MESLRGIFRTVALIAGIAAAVSLAPPISRAADDTGGSSGSEQVETAAPTVDDMLDRLSKAASEAEAKSLEEKIVAAWNRSGSDTVDYLSRRAAVAVKEKNFGLALQYLDTIVELEPDHAEGWNLRATVYYLIDEYELSLADISRVLALQPRHFGALSGLGMIFRELDQPDKALEAFRKVLAIHPYFGNARESIEKLEPEVEGRDI